MADWEFLVRKVVIDGQAEDAEPQVFRVEADDGYEPLTVRREEGVASGLPDGLKYEIIFARRA